MKPHNFNRLKPEVGSRNFQVQILSVLISELDNSIVIFATKSYACLLRCKFHSVQGSYLQLSVNRIFPSCSIILLIVFMYIFSPKTHTFYQQ